MWAKLNSRQAISSVLLVGCAISATATVQAQQRSDARQIADSWIDQNEQLPIALSDDIWKYAEPSFQEFRSADRIKSEFEKAGFKVESNVAGLPTALVASFSVGSGLPVIGIVAEYDTPVAAGLSQRAGAPRREELVRGDYGHACGHNMIAGSSVAAAIALKEAMTRAGISGTVKFFGTPAEEVLTGKVYMADAGVFDGLDAAIAWHPGPNFEARFGVSPSMDRVKFTFSGKAPANAVQAATSLQQHAAGAEAVLRGNMADVKVAVRAPTREGSRQKLDAIRAQAKAIALQTGTTLDEQYIAGIRPRLVNMGLVRLMDGVMRDYAPARYTPEEQQLAVEISKTFDSPVAPDQMLPRLRAPTGEVGSVNDNSEVSWITPFISVRGGAYVNGITPHTWQQTALASSPIGHKAVIVMTHVLSAAALELMTKPAVLADIRGEFKQKTAGFTYQADLPRERNWRWANR